MLSKFTNPYTGSVLLIQRPREVADFIARQPRVLDARPRPEPTPGRAYYLAITALRVLFVLLMLALLVLAFVLLAEERPERVRPELTPAQRAKAFRIPHH